MARSISPIACMACLTSACSLLAPSDDKLLRPSRPADAAIDFARNDARPGSGGSGGSSVIDATIPQPEIDAAAEASGGFGPEIDAGEAAAGSCKTSEDCASGRYCSPEGVCTSCSDITSKEPTDIEFGEPEPLAVVNASGGDDGLRFPRAFERGTKLFYERAYYGANSIWLTGDFEQNEGAPIGFPIDGPGPEGGPLAMSTAGGVLAEYNFFFTRNLADGGLANENQLFMARIDPAGTGSAVTQLPAPFSASPRKNLSLALSRDRAWWTVNLDGSLNVQLWTTPLTGDLIPSRVSLTLASGCGIIEFDYAPWATPDGRLLFVTFAERGETCNHVGENSTDIGLVKVTSAGQAQGPVVPLNVNRAVLSDTDASLSHDMCWLFFSSNRHESRKLRLYRARRMR